jgi:hypothetical protein
MVGLARAQGLEGLSASGFECQFVAAFQRGLAPFDVWQRRHNELPVS